MLALAAASPLVPAPLYLPWCLALRHLAGRRSRPVEVVGGVPVHALAEGGAHDAIGIGCGRWGLVLASRPVLADPAWPGLRAHLLSHVRRGDGLRACAVLTIAAALAPWQPLVLIPGALVIALVAREGERRADAAAAMAVCGDAHAVQAFARYAARDGLLARGPVFRLAVLLLRRLRLASHPEPARRSADFLAAVAAQSAAGARFNRE